MRFGLRMTGRMSVSTNFKSGSAKMKSVSATFENGTDTGIVIDLYELWLIGQDGDRPMNCG